MTLRFSRSLDEMRPVLLDPSSTGLDPVYVVYKDLNNSWENKTILSSGLYGQEFAKTFGHYHADGKDEVYKIESGEGVLILQDENEVRLIKVTAGQRVTILAKYAHAWINVGKVPLISYDDHHNPKDDYEKIKAKHGLAYYLINDNGQIKTIPNPNYQNPPEPKWESV